MCSLCAGGVGGGQGKREEEWRGEADFSGKMRQRQNRGTHADKKVKFPVSHCASPYSGRMVCPSINLTLRAFSGWHRGEDRRWQVVLDLGPLPVIRACLRDDNHRWAGHSVT